LPLTPRRGMETGWGVSMVSAAGLIHEAAPGSTPGAPAAQLAAVVKSLPACYCWSCIRPAAHRNARGAAVMRRLVL
jgi:hypothetical protein